MSMKPRSIWEKNTTADIAKEISGCVNQPKTIDEFSNVEQTNTKLKFIEGTHEPANVITKAQQTRD